MPKKLDPIEQAQLIYQGIKAGAFTTPATFDSALERMFSYLDEQKAGVEKLDRTGRETPEEIRQTLHSAGKEGFFIAARHREQEISGGSFTNNGSLRSAVSNMLDDLKASGKTLADLEKNQSSGQVEDALLSGAREGLRHGQRLNGSTAPLDEVSLAQIKAVLDSAGTSQSASAGMDSRIDALMQNTLLNAKNPSADRQVAKAGR